MGSFDDFMIGEAVKNGDETRKLQSKCNELRAALQVLLDSVDYTAGACGPTEMVAAVLPVVLIEKARKALTRS